MNLRRTALLIVASVAIGQPMAQAQNFSVQPLQVPLSTPTTLHSPLRDSAGHVVLVESDEQGENSRRLRFSEDGGWLGVVPYNGRSLLKPTGHGDFLSIQSSRFRSYCDLHAVNAQFTMTWRHAALLRYDDELEAGDCGHFATDVEKRLWFADADWRIGHLRADGSLGSERDLRQFLAPNQTVQTSAVTTWRNAPGAIYAFSDVLNATRSELVAFDPGMTVRWRRMLSTSAAASVDVAALHAGEDQHLRVVGSGRSQDGEAVRLYAAEIGADGELLWSRYYDAFPAISVQRSHRFADGSIGVLYLASTSDPNQLEYRIAVLAANGEVQRAFGAGSTPLWTVRFTEFVELGDGSRWLFSNRFGIPNMTGLVWDLDHGGTLQTLPIGQQVGILPRARGDALVFGTTLGASVMRFDGVSNAGRITFTPAQPLADSPYPLATARLPDDGRVLMWQAPDGIALARFSAASQHIWSTRAHGMFDTSLQTRPASPLLLTSAGQICVVTIDVNDAANVGRRQLECFALDDGMRRFAYSLPTVSTSLLHATVAADGIELLFGDADQIVHHRVAGADGSTRFERVLGHGTPLLLAPGLALMRTIGESTQLVESRRSEGAAVMHTLEAESPLLTDDVLARVGSDEYLFAREVSVDGQSMTRLRMGRGDSSSAVRWSRDIAAGRWRYWNQGGLAGIGSQTIFLFSYDNTSGHESVHRIRITDGSEVEPAVKLGSIDVERTATDLRGDGGLVVASAHSGQVEWREFAADGRQRSVGSWRCSGDCGRIVAVPGGRETLVWTGDNFTDHTLLALSSSASARRVPKPDDGAITGVFVASNDTNRGYVIDWLPSARIMFVARFAGDGSQTTTRERLDWETMQGVVPAGVDAITLPRYRNANGRFATADDAPIAPFGSATFRFDGCDAAELTLIDNSGAQPLTEVVHLRRSGPRVKTCNLLDGTQIAAQATLPARGGFDSRQSGAWVASGASDQGLLAAVLPATASANGVFFAPWFTYWNDAGSNPETSNRHWLTLQGTLTPATNGSVALTIYRATAGSHGPVRPSNTHRIGTATWTLLDCEHATLSYLFDNSETAQPFSGRNGTQSYVRPGACSGSP